MIQLDTCIQKSCKCSMFYAAFLVNYLYVQCNKPFLKYQCRAIQFIFHTVMKYMYYSCHYNSIQDYLVSEQYAMTLLISSTAEEFSKLSRELYFWLSVIDEKFLEGVKPKFPF